MLNFLQNKKLLRVALSILVVVPVTTAAYFLFFNSPSLHRTLSKKEFNLHQATTPADKVAVVDSLYALLKEHPDLLPYFQEEMLNEISQLAQEPIYVQELHQSLLENGNQRTSKFLPPYINEITTTAFEKNEHALVELKRIIGELEPKKEMFPRLYLSAFISICSVYHQQEQIYKVQRLEDEHKEEHLTPEEKKMSSQHNKIEFDSSGQIFYLKKLQTLLQAPENSDTLAVFQDGTLNLSDYVAFLLEQVQPQAHTDASKN